MLSVQSCSVWALHIAFFFLIIIFSYFLGEGKYTRQIDRWKGFNGLIGWSIMLGEMET